MALNHTNPGAQPHDSAPGPVALNRTTPGPQDRQYSFAEGFEIATTELHKSIVAGSVDGHRPRREHAPSEPAYGDGITW